ncbi:MAG: EAL domain-containing protein [Alphaproteobacteria bacterium]|nr:EAL domain-containing protein [Alphaproteobacteria bacterium]
MAESAKKSIRKGDILIREGERGDSAYILETGSVEILILRDGTLMQIGTRGPGSIIGEMAMIDDKPRTATIRALEDCTVMEISRAEFTHRVESADPIVKMVMRVILARYRDMIGRAQVMRLPAHAAVAVETAENSGELHDLAVGAIKIHNELKTALEKNELVLFYQPIISMRDMKISGFEALMRWKHPEKGLISPGVFIPVAEESGLIVEMSHWALGSACDAVKDLHAAIDPKLCGTHPPFVSVNFSVKDFSKGDFSELIRATLERKGTNPAHIHLEITESLLMESPGPAKVALDKCRQFGTSVSIDDFGTGYSSLSYLHHFPIDTLKIDQTFIRSMGLDLSSKVLVKSIIGLAHSMGIKVIAEGIETREEAALLKEMGCEECQGYWFAKPMPLADALTFVKNWTPPALA